MLIKKITMTNMCNEEYEDFFTLAEKEADCTGFWRNTYTKKEKNEEKKDKKTNLWQGKIFCLIGFYERKSHKRKILVSKLLQQIIHNGGGFILEESLQKQSKNIQKRIVDYFICNFSSGYSICPGVRTNSSNNNDINSNICNDSMYLNHNNTNNSIHNNQTSYNNVATPLWLYFCHLDNIIYPINYLPFFMPNQFFSSPSLHFSPLRVCLLGCIYNYKNNPCIKKNKEEETKKKEKKKIREKNDIKMLTKFIEISGGVFLSEKKCEETFLHTQDKQRKEKNKNNISTVNALPSSNSHHVSNDDDDTKNSSLPTHIVICKDKGKINEYIVNAARSAHIPIVNLQWIFDSYLHGVLLPSYSSYSVNLSEECEILAFSAPSPKVNDEAESLLRSTALKSHVMYISHRVALNCTEMVTKCRQMGAVAVYIQRPSNVLIHGLCEEQKTDKEEEKENENKFHKNILVVEQKEVDDGLWDEILFILAQKNNSKNDNSLCNDNNNINNLSRKYVRKDIHVVTQNWIKKCWERRCAVSISLDNGGILVPRHLLDVHLDACEDKEEGESEEEEEDSLGSLNDRRRKRKNNLNLTMYDLANSVVCGGGGAAEGDGENEEDAHLSSTVKNNMLSSSNLYKRKLAELRNYEEKAMKSKMAAAEAEKLWQKKYSKNI